MKVLSTLFIANLFGASAFSINQAAKVSNTALQASPETSLTTTDPKWFPSEMPGMRRFEGGESLKTLNVPAGAGHAQMLFFTDNGRPLHAQVEMWLGPIRRMHNMEIYNESGGPFRAILSLKKQAQTLKIGSLSTYNFPFYAGVTIPPKEDSPQIADMIQNNFEEAELRTKVQGANTDGKFSAIRTFPIPLDVESCQIVCWSKHTGKKSLRARIELCQGPNNPKQTYNLQCSGSYQPYTCVVPTPGPGWTLRIANKKFLEDGLFEMAVIPYETSSSEYDTLQWSD